MKNFKNFEEERNEILKGFEEVYRKLIIYKRKINSPLIIERDGKIIALDPFEAPDTISYKTKK